MEAVEKELKPHRDEHRGTGSLEPTQAEGIEGFGQQFAFAFDDSAKVTDDKLDPKDPVDKDSTRITRLATAAAAAETKSDTRQPTAELAPPDMRLASGNRTPDEGEQDALPGETAEETRWYEGLNRNQLRGMYPRGTNPPFGGATWVAVEEVHSKRYDRDE